MPSPKFILSKLKVLEQYNVLKDLGLKVSYSFKTNKEVAKVLENTDSDFSIHAKEEIDLITNKEKIWFFSQAWNKEDLKEITDKGVKSFVIDNEADLNTLLEFLKTNPIKINLSLRMKFQEHRIGTGKYFVYGMPSIKVNELIQEIKNHPSIEKIGIHIHRKSQNTSEWEIKKELQDSITKENLERINIVNLGGGLPIKYKTYTSEVLPYIFQKITEAKLWLEQYNIETCIEPGRFIAGPAVKLETQIIQIYQNNIVINTTIYNCALDSILTNTKMIIQQELEETDETSNENPKEDNAKFYLIKGNSPTRDDIFRYKVKLANPKIGDKITFLNAGAYNYTTDFFGYKKLETKVIN